MLFLMVLYSIFSEDNGNFQYFKSKNAYIFKIIRDIGLVFYSFQIILNRHPWIRGTFANVEKVL